MRTIFYLGVVIGLTGCSSGGTSSTETLPTNNAPSVNAGVDQTVAEGASVTLTSSSSDADGDSVTLSWSQTAGATVTLSSTTAQSVSFTAPDVTSVDTLVFQITASDGTTTASDSVSVSVTDESVNEKLALFETDSMTGAPTIVNCTLSGGTSSSCISVTLNATPTNYTVGPWCPRNISDGASAGGIWLENSQAYDVTGSFIENLSSFYGDANWQMFDPATGAINYTETAEECDGAARPNVDPSLQNHCVECLPSFVTGVSPANYTIPLAPSLANSATSGFSNGIGVAYTGIRIDGPAPVDAILGAYTLAPFDDCGGHINPVVGYHIHAITDDCLKEVAGTDVVHAPAIGLAMDGFPMHERLNADGNEPTDLDQCRGHTTEADGYHYHVNTAGSNNILPCLSGETAQ